MRSILGITTAFMLLGFLHAGGPVRQVDPEEIESKLRKVREQLEKLRAEERVLAEQLAEARASTLGSIKAEVTGVLRHHAKGDSYYISVWHPNGETRIWLPSPSGKLKEELGTLHGKLVVAKGNMAQRHESKSVPYPWSINQVPVGGFYFWSFEIAAAPASSTKKP